MAKDNPKKDESKSFKGILTPAPERESKKNFKKIAIKALCAVAVIAIIAALPRYFGPKAQVERSFNRCVKALEKMDRPAVMGFVSERFTNPMITEKSALDAMMEQMFKQFKYVKVHIVSKEVKSVEKDKAVLLVEGSIYFKDEREQMYRVKSEAPITINLVKEDRKWRMISVEGLSLDMISIMKDEFLQQPAEDEE